ncbi:MAG: hypothetical protein AB7F98_00265 [Novosphingobium sp.]
MGTRNQNGSRSGATAGLMLAGAVCLLALPSAVLAFSSRFEPRFAAEPADQPIAAIKAPDMSVHLADSLPARSLGKGQLFHFTPAGTENRPDRSVTVAVRVDARTAQALASHPVGAAIAQASSGPKPLQIAPTAFNLGVSRGYHGFAQGLVPPVDVRRIDMPDLASYRSGQPAAGDASRFNPRVVLDDRQPAGRSPRTFADKQDTVDLGGSYSVTRNFDVTAGVRYSQERDRLRPLNDGKQDSQAVYLGTQFRF